MKLINQNSSNSVPFRLGEKSTLTGTTYYLFKLTNPQTREEVFFTGYDISTSPSIWSEFTIIETGSTSTDLTNSTISLKPAGWWEYEVFQQTVQGNIDPTLAEGMIESGKIRISASTSPSHITTSYTGQSQSNTVYYKR